tara:strand:+ start:76 stop:675 length:600 start_codon:yes stop_codon:yes gene_type:complete
MIKNRISTILPSYYNATQCKEIEDICLTFPEKDAKVISTKEKNNTTTTNEVRRSKIRFVKVDGMDGDFLGASHLATGLYSLVDSINSSYYNFSLGGVDSIQYTEYDASYSGHYGWHTDWNWSLSMNPIRKLSMTIQLSDGNDYEGGEFEIAHDLPKDNLHSKKLGTVICFPSMFYHRVLPVTKGLRKSLVVWFTGPKFV